MGQAQSEELAAPSSPEGQFPSQRFSSSFSPSSPSPSSASRGLQRSASSMESLIAEAAEYGNEENESLDAKAEKALECPCISDLRCGPCGVQFSDAFLCFLKSTVEEKGSDCVNHFVALQNCFKANPDAFSKVGEATEEEEPAQEYKIIPPSWARESPTPKSKL